MWSPRYDHGCHTGFANQAEREDEERRRPLTLQSGRFMMASGCQYTTPSELRRLAEKLAHRQAAHRSHYDVAKSGAAID